MSYALKGVIFEFGRGRIGSLADKLIYRTNKCELSKLTNEDFKELHGLLAEAINRVGSEYSFRHMKQAQPLVETVEKKETHEEG